MLTSFELEDLAYIVKNGGENLEINVPDEDGWLLLHSASYYGNLSIVSYIMNHEVNLEAVIPGVNMTALLLAAMSGFYEIVQVLLENGANVNHVDHMGRTALHLTNSGKVCEILLKNGIDYNLKDFSSVYIGETALEAAIRENKIDVISAIKSYIMDLGQG